MQRVEGSSSKAARTAGTYLSSRLTFCVQIHDIGEQDYVHYFSMEFVEGEDLLT
jgi:hypothetical protein